MSAGNTRQLVPASAPELVTPPPTGGAGGAGVGFGAGGAAGLAVGAGAAGVAAFDSDGVGELVLAVLVEAAAAAELAGAALEATALEIGDADPALAEATAAVSEEAGAEGGAGAAFLVE